MLSKVKGKNYLIMEPGEKYYSRVNKSKLDRSLKKIIRALEVGIAFDCNNITYNQTECPKPGVQKEGESKLSPTKKATVNQ